MPSACTKPDNKASAEAPNQFIQCISVVEKKVRNLEKRKGKLDGYRDKQDAGVALNADQQEAVSKYDGVIQNLEFARELQKQFQVLSNDLEKYLKKRAKRDKIERQEQEMLRTQEILKLQDLLSNMGLDEVREDFKSGSHGAIKLSDTDLDHIDELYKIITPSREGETSYKVQLTRASEHIVNLQESREKDVIGTTYKQLKSTVDKIHNCGYFDNLGKTPEEPAQEEEKEPETTPAPEPETEQTNLQAEVESAEPEPVVVHHEPEPVQILAPEPSVPVHPTVQQVAVEPVQVYNVEDDSFFTTAIAAHQPRGFQEIVSSVQGSFNFLQESEIDVDYAALQQAGYQLAAEEGSSAATYTQHVVSQPNQDMVGHHAAAQPAALSHSTHTDSLDYGAASTPSMSESVQQSSLSSQIQFGAVDGMGLDAQSSSLGVATTQSTSLDEYDQTYGQNLMSQTLGGSTSSQHVTSYGDQSNLMASNMAGLQDQSGGSSVPPPIPMPDEVMPGQSLITQAYSATDSENTVSQEKKAYTMNPNADPFQSNTMFSQNTVSTISQSSAGLPQTTSSGSSMMTQEERKPAWQTTVTQSQPPQHSSEYNKGFPADGFGGSSQYSRGASSAPRGGRGGPRGGATSRGMNNGFSRGGNRGGGGSGYNGNRGNYNSRGGGRGGSSWQGFPPRNDYRPDGGYQGYNNSFNQGGVRGGSQRGGSGGMRGGRGGSASYNRNQPYSQQA